MPGSGSRRARVGAPEHPRRGAGAACAHRRPRAVRGRGACGMRMCCTALARAFEPWPERHPLHAPPQRESGRKRNLSENYHLLNAAHAAPGRGQLHEERGAPPRPRAPSQHSARGRTDRHTYEHTRTQSRSHTNTRTQYVNSVVNLSRSPTLSRRQCCPPPLPARFLSLPQLPS